MSLSGSTAQGPFRASWPLGLVLVGCVARFVWYQLQIGAFGGDNAYWFDFARQIGTGHLALTHLAGWKGVDQSAFIHPPLYPFLLSLVDGALDGRYWYLSGNLLSFAFAVLELIVFSRLLGRLGITGWTAGAALAGLALDPFFDSFSTFPSYGALLMLLSLTALWLASEALEGSLVKAILAGMVSGLTTLTLYVGAAVGLGIGLGLIVRRRGRLAVGFALGALVVVAPLALYIWGDAARHGIFQAQMAALANDRSYGSSLLNIPRTVWGDGKFSFVGWLGILAAPVALATAVRKREDSGTVFMAAASVCCGFLLLPGSFVAIHRLVAFHPYYPLLLAALPHRGTPRRIAYGLLCLGAAGASLRFTRELFEGRASGQQIQYNAASVARMEATLRARIPRTARILAPDPFRLVFPEWRNVYDSLLINVCDWSFYPRERSIAQVVREDLKFTPDMIVLPDPRFEPGFSPQNCPALSAYLGQGFRQADPLILEGHRLDVWERQSRRDRRISCNRK